MTPLGSSHREVEHKFTVTAEFELPDLVATGVVASWQAIPAFALRAVYYDTDDLRLIRNGITLRRRVGGPDEGWHVKLPISTARAWEREEIHVALADFVPPELADLLMPVTRGERLSPQATVLTNRSPISVLDARGQVRAEIVDDRVEVHSTSGRVIAFREVEVEATDASVDTSVMDAIADVLIAQGARPSTMSKAAGVLGPRAQLPPDIPTLTMPGPQGAAADAVLAAFAGYARHLIIADIGVRRDAPDSVHQVRVACRRLRSALRTFSSLLDPSVSEPLRMELGWLASELGPWRDTEVIAEQLGVQVSDLGADAPTVEYLTRHFTGRLADARVGALAALRSDRHNLLLDDLVDFIRHPPLLPHASLPVDDVLPPLIWRSWRSLSRSVRLLELDGPAPDWHAARIKAKRARYAVDLASQVFAEPVQQFAERLSDVTDALGEHQDAYVAQEVLSLLVEKGSSSAGLPSAHVSFVLGRMHEQAADRELQARFTFTRVWPQARKAARRSGLGG